MTENCGRFNSSRYFKYTSSAIEKNTVNTRNSYFHQTCIYIQATENSIVAKLSVRHLVAYLSQQRPKFDHKLIHLGVCGG